MKKLIKRIWIIWIIAIFNILSLPNFITTAQNVDGFNIIPELTEEEAIKANQKIKEIWSTWWEVMNKYREVAAKDFTIEQQLATWVMNRDTIMNYLVFVIQFLSQLWLLVWVVFIMYAWYKYMVSVFEGWKTPSSTVKNAIIWVLIIIFSYAIMRILTSLIWLT
jgi:hypothetical protein